MAADLAARLPGFGDVAWILETGSTNVDLIGRARMPDVSALPMPWLLGTHLQVSGRGRAGRPWQNESGACLMLSCAFNIQMPGHRLPALSPLAGLAACEALRSLVAPDVARQLQVKWPNDVQFDEKKLGGILVETTRASSGKGYVVVIGMGLNLNNAKALSTDLQRDIADWSEVCPSGEAGPAALAAALAGGWQNIIVEAGIAGFAGLRDRFSAADALHERIVNVLDQGRILFSGRACGYDEHGRLQVATPEGIMPVSVGDVSVRLKA